MSIEMAITTCITGETLTAAFDNVDEAIQWMLSVEYEDSERLSHE